MYIYLLIILLIMYNLIKMDFMCIVEYYNKEVIIYV